jgi:creatinine amidohydrolase
LTFAQRIVFMNGVDAGTDETSLVLHLAPDLVDLSTTARRVPEHPAENRHVRFSESVSLGWLSDDFDETGVTGDPTALMVEHGAVLSAGAFEAFCAVLAELSRFEFTSS